MMPTLTDNTLAKQQVNQDQHDRLAHQDIYNLPRADRIKHLALHLAKYVGRIGQSDPLLVRKTLVDCFLIVISLVNAVDGELVGVVVPSHTVRPGDRTQRWAEPVGRIAKACESMDHLESVDYRSEIYAGSLDLLAHVFADADEAEVDLLEAADEMRLKIQSRLPFFRSAAST